MTPSFKEFLKSLVESPIVAPGSMPKPRNYPNTIKTVGLDLYWSNIGKVLGYECYMAKDSSLAFIIVDPDSTVKDLNHVICEARCKAINLDSLGYKNAIEIDRIYINESYRIRGLANNFYKLLLRQGFSVVSGGVQFLGARRLWALLSKELVVDVVDISDKSVLEKNHKLEHGLNDFEYPTKYYSEYDFRYEKYRFVLKSIK